MRSSNLSHLSLALTTVAVLGLAPSLPAAALTFRSFDGSGNNSPNPTWGQAGTQLLRLTSPAYDGGISTPRGGFNPSSLPNPRAISNGVANQGTRVILNSLGASNWIWQWGQFLDHDLDFTPAGSEQFNIPVPAGDPSFDPGNTGMAEIPFNRSVFDPTTGTDPSNPRQQSNQITSYIDASNVYGSDAERADALRLNDGSGMLKSSSADNNETLLMLNDPDNPLEMDNPTGLPIEQLYIAGDIRANEQVGLTAAHTLFLREHNRLAGEIEARLDGGDQTLIAKRDEAIADPNNNVNDEGDFVYQATRLVVGAQMQQITYQEFLPVLLGPNALSAFEEYDPTVNAGISNEFSTAAFRVGHTMLSPEIMRLNPDGTVAAGGPLSLRDAFFSPNLVKENGIDSLLLGLASGQAQEVDTFLVDDVRNFLFGPPGAGGLDLASLNLQRGRDHGLGSLNQVRIELGLDPYTSFLDLTGGNAELAAAFAVVYGEDNIDLVDLWIGGLAEPQVNGGLVGETFFWIIVDQFTRLRDGDRFFYGNDEMLAHILAFAPDFEGTKLSDIIRRNSSITNIQDNAFLYSESHQVSTPEPSSLASLLLLGVGGLYLKRRDRR